MKRSHLSFPKNKDLLQAVHFRCVDGFRTTIFKRYEHYEYYKNISSVYTTWSFLPNQFYYFT